MYANLSVLAQSCTTNKVVQASPGRAGQQPATQSAARDEMQAHTHAQAEARNDRHRNSAARALFAPGERVRLQSLLGGVPPQFAVCPPGTSFFNEAVVLDADEELARGNPQAAKASALTMIFSVARPWQSISFCIGVRDGSSLLSYSMPTAFYRVQDGSQWCQHIDFFDADDIRQMGQRQGLMHSARLTQGMAPQELMAAVGHKHTPMDDAEYYAHIFPAAVYQTLLHTNRLPAGAFFCTRVFDPASLEVVGTWRPPDAYSLVDWVK